MANTAGNEKPVTYPEISRLVSEIPDILMPFGMFLYGKTSLHDAWNDFWLGEDEPISFDHPWIGLFLPYFMYHWYPDDEERYNPEDVFPCKATIGAQYLERNRESLSPIHREFLESMLREPLTFWMVMAIEEGKGVTIKDLFTGRTVFTHDVECSHKLNKWDLIFAKVAEVATMTIMGALGPYSLPLKWKNTVLEEVHRINPDSTMQPVDLLEYDFDLLTLYQSVMERAFNPPAPTLVNTDGEPIMSVTSRYTFHESRRREIMDTLDTMRYIDRSGRSEFKWHSSVKDDETTIKGSIFVKTNVLRTECNSVERDKKLRKKLLVKLDKLVKYAGSREKPIKLGKSRKSDKAAPGTIDPESLDEATRKILRQKIEDHYMKWADTSIPAFGGKTPREVVCTPQGREKVRDLIDEWENEVLRAKNPDMQFDFNRLRKKLGLDIE